MTLGNVFLLTAGLAVGNAASAHAQTADAIYYGGDILTMAGKSPQYVERLAVKGGKIVYAGNAAGVAKFKGAGTKAVNLNGKTLLPGFIDAHSHFINSLSIAEQANVYPAPFGPGNSVQGIIAALKKLQKERNIPKGEIISAYGYDENAVKPQLTVTDLDKAFPDNPVMVNHISLHGGVFTSDILKKYNITKDTPTPAGGVIVRNPATKEPVGLVMEMAFLPIFSDLPKPSEAALMDSLGKGQTIYAAAGVTTAQEGATHLSDLQILQKGAAADKLYIDVVAYPFITDLENILKDNPPATFGKYNHGLKLGGVKITSDGSPQGRTAYFTTPYLQGGPGGEKNWRGEPSFPSAELQRMVKRVYSLNLDLIIHANGDAAIDEILKAHEMALGDKKTQNRRTAVIHSQFVRPDQLKKYVAYHIIPSYYTEHTYFFAAAHYLNRGKKQTEFLSPMRTSIDMGLRCANHTDFAVAPIDQLFTVWTAVNRVSREGKVVGASERITPYEGLMAITSVPAYWYREENRKGSLEAGKLADLVILDKNPLKVKPMAIKDIKVMETIKEGKTIFPHN